LLLTIFFKTGPRGPEDFIENFSIISDNQMGTLFSFSGVRTLTGNEYAMFTAKQNPNYSTCFSGGIRRRVGYCGDFSLHYIIISSKKVAVNTTQKRFLGLTNPTGYYG
jgi:hypothetical protein